MTMPEKAANALKEYSWLFGSGRRVHWAFKVLIFAVFLGLLFVWGIDGWDVGSFHKDLLVVKLTSISHKDFTQPHQNFSQFDATIQFNLSVPKRLSPPHDDLASIISNPIVNELNSTKNSLVSSMSSGDLEWISVEVERNYTKNLIAKWLEPGGEPCKESQTVDILIPDLDGIDTIELSSGKIYEFVFQAVDEFGKPRCLGGDYFETDISGEKWKSRPPVRDLGNGTYTFSLQVHPDFHGMYEFSLFLLFRHYQGLKSSPERFSVDKVLRKIPISFVESDVKLPEIAQCKKSDLTRDIWSGRWTRHARNDSCEISNDGRYRCQDPNFPCQDPWCFGSLGLLESNGWTYSAHCSFKLFSGEEAWNCLNNRWLFFWGDSNHCDSIRNILNFILNMDFKVVPRRFDMNVTNPINPKQTVRITSIFNGNSNETGNYQGLSSLYNEPYRELLKSYFSQGTVPDTLIMNSGLHDGVFWPTLRRFTKGAEDAAAFWSEVLEGVRQRGLVPPDVIFRSTIATGGYARRMAFNPSKMEAFNGVILEKLRQFGVVTKVIDHFDMTYPWHYDNRCNDGVHYGRAPAKMRWRDGEIGHQYFVDLMLCHVLLNAICAQ